jgi:hypothetical protein
MPEVWVSKSPMVVFCQMRGTFMGSNLIINLTPCCFNCMARTAVVFYRPDWASSDAAGVECSISAMPRFFTFMGTHRITIKTSPESCLYQHFMAAALIIALEVLLQTLRILKDILYWNGSCLSILVRFKCFQKTIALRIAQSFKRKWMLRIRQNQL